LSGLSRQPASITRPRTPRPQRGGEQLAEVPVVAREVGATTRMSPSWHCSTATWIIQLSPGGTLTVTAVPAIAAPG
jgi:hypothetical protein